MLCELPEEAFRRGLIAEVVFASRYHESGYAYVLPQRSEHLGRLRRQIELVRRGEVPRCVGNRGDHVEHDDDGNDRGNAGKGHPRQLPSATRDGVYDVTE